MKIVLNSKNFYIFFFITFIIFLKSANSADVTISSGTTTDQQTLQANSTLTIKSGAALSESSTDRIVKGYNPEIDNATVVVEENATIEGRANTIFVRETSGFTLINSGSIIGNGSKAINLRSAQNATITNNKGATISGTSNTIVHQAGGDDSGAEEATGLTITNSGTIKAEGASSQRAIYIYQSGGNLATDATITNSSTGNIYNTQNYATISIDTSSSLTNSGRIENRFSPTSKSIHVVGDNNTITLKDGGIVIGLIDSDGSGNKLKFQHGVGKSYYYKTEGTFTLEDLDGNQVVKGSAGSVGQGASETIDELLSYKSINLRNFAQRYKNSDFKDKKEGWGETFASYLNRDGNNQNLALEYDLYNLGANLMYSLENSNFLISFDSGLQNLAKDHRIIYQNVTGGIYNSKNPNFLNLETLLLSGITLKNSERTILTNTTSSGTLDTKGNFITYEIYSDFKKNNNILPDIGFSGNFSITPAYDENYYYKWENKKVGNLIFYLSDLYKIKESKLKDLSINWGLDFRSLVGDKSQNYSINGTKVTYTQDSDLTKEITLKAGMNFKKKIMKDGILSYSLDAINTTQGTRGISGNIIFELKF